MTETVKKKNGFLIFSGVLLGISLIIGAMAVILASSPRTQGVRSLNLGNRYLSDMDYEAAIASYREVLEIDERNEEALRGLMQAAYSSDDMDLLREALDAYQDSGISDPDMDRMSDNLNELLRNAGLEEAASLIDKGKYEKALDLIEDLSDGSQEDIIALQVQLYEKCAENAWKERRFEDALEYFKKALELTDDESVRSHLINVAEGYVNDCINHQDYDKAGELIKWVQDTCGDNALKGYEERVADMESFDDSLQSKLEELNSAFENDDVKLIEDLMNSRDFKEFGKQVRTVFYSDSLKDSDKPEGTGTAIYIQSGNLYVYYGEFANGLRNGHGLYYYSSDNDHLTKLSLNWIDDVPQGSGTGEMYSTMITWNNGVKVKETDMIKNLEFTLKDGRYDGDVVEHSQVLGDEGYSYDWTIPYHDGVPERLMPGDYPAEICDYLGNPNAVLTVWTRLERNDGWGGTFTTTIWDEWRPGRYGVDGYTDRSEAAVPEEMDAVPLD